jgi:hypothetical protein
MSISFARPDIANLEFQLYERSVHPELFRIHAQTRADQTDYTALVRICDAGHTVSFRYAGATVTEVTAAHGQPLPQQKRVIERRLKGCRDDCIEFPSGLRYQVSYQLEELDPDIFLNFHEELVIDCNQANVAHRFPSVSRLAPGPLSLIRFDSGPDSLLVHAFHTFPESCAVVKTQSLFELG